MKPPLFEIDGGYPPLETPSIWDKDEAEKVTISPGLTSREPDPEMDIFLTSGKARFKDPSLKNQKGFYGKRGEGGLRLSKRKGGGDKVSKKGSWLGKNQGRLDEVPGILALSTPRPGTDSKLGKLETKSESQNLDKLFDSNGEKLVIIDSNVNQLGQSKDSDSDSNGTNCIDSDSNGKILLSDSNGDIERGRSLDTVKSSLSSQRPSVNRVKAPVFRGQGRSLQIGEARNTS